MIGMYVLYAVFFGLSLFMLYAFTQYGKPVQLIVGPVTFGGTQIYPPPPVARPRMNAECCDHTRLIEMRRGNGSLTIRAAAGARIVLR